VLFSNDQVAAFVSNNFEPCWEMVRPVPIVRIDFGNGTIVTRTLHGNIATYACAADGEVLDILPGIYAATEYQNALDQLRLLALYAKSQPDAAQRTAYVRAYHEQQAAALRKGQAPQRLVDIAKLAAVGKGKIERPVEVVVAQRPIKQTAGAQAAPLASREDVASWKELAEDTRINETARRLLIHDMLAKSPEVQPVKVTKWLYKEVLHADLDDPYLGLGEVLFATYPFAKEDKTR
jgi:hypothetical protein